jgi:hypothetical protein
MSHASLTNDGLLLGLLAAVLVLVTFIRAVFRAPLQPGQPPAQPVPGDPGPQDARLRALAAASPQPSPPAANTAGHGNSTGYLARHAAPGSPPWEPAPKPPGIGALPGRHQPGARSQVHPAPQKLAAA